MVERALFDALPRAVVVCDLDRRILLWNEQAERIYGWPADEVVGRDVVDVLVPAEDRAQRRDVLDAVGGGQGWEGGVTIIRRDGTPVRVWLTHRPVRDEDGHAVAIVGTSEDVTERRRLQQQAAELTEHLQLTLEAGGLGTFRWDMASGATTWDTRVEQLFGLEPGMFDGTFDGWVSLLHPDDAESVLATLQDAIAAKGRYRVEHRVVWPDGSVHWIHGAGQVTLGPDGEVTGAIGFSADVTEQVLGRQELHRLTGEALQAAEQERRSRERLEALGRINDALAESRERDDLLRNVTAAAVPALGDSCAIYLLTAEPGEVAVDVAHRDPAVTPILREEMRQLPYDPEAPIGVPRVIRSGRPELRRTSPTDPVLGEETDELATCDSIIVPLVKRGRVLGAMQLRIVGPGRRYEPDDLPLAKAAADRIASSVENVRLTGEQRRIAATLQASLLPDGLPEIPGIDLAVRYWATGEGIDVGGDFYDVFEVQDGLWAVVVGDVCGTGPSAAAVTGLARHTIATAAWHGDAPASVLENLNRSMRARSTDRFCSVAYGTLEPSPAGVALTVTCGGHPLPILVRADGSVTTVGRPGTLIGVLDQIKVTTATAQLVPGDTLVLYTDGCTDVPPPHHLDAQQFAALVGGAARRTVSSEALAEAIRLELSKVLPIEQRVDDMALLIVRLPAARASSAAG